MKQFLLFLAFAFFSIFNINAQTCADEPCTSISDSNLEQKLVSLGVDTNGMTGNILNSDAIGITSLNLSNHSNTPDSEKINSMNGIEIFTDLVEINLEYNDFFGTPLDDWFNNLEYLEILNVNYCQISGLAFLSFNDTLKELYCKGNLMSEIYFSSTLEVLDISQNQLTDLNIGNLKYLDCSSNQIIELTRSVLQNNLEYLDCSFNGIPLLNLSEYPLNFLKCNDNLLQYLDASNNNYTFFDFSNNENTLEFLDISNTNLSNVSHQNSILKSFKANNCSSLTSINLANNSLTTFEAHNSNSLQSVDIRGNALETIDVGNTISLEFLYCSQNELTSLDVTASTLLKVLTCNNNQLADLNISTNTMLTTLNCSFNAIASLNISNNTNLEILYCSGNDITSLDTSSNPDLVDLICHSNEITSLNLSSNTLLENLEITNNDLTTPDTFLQSLNISNTNLSSLNQTSTTNSPVRTLNLNSFTANNCTNITELLIESDSFNSITIQNNPNLQNLTVTSLDVVAGPIGGNVGNGLDLASLPSLNQLTCSGIGLTNLNISSFPNLQYLDCSTNFLTEIDTSNNNELSTIFFDQNETLETLDISNTKIASVSIVNSQFPNLITINASNCSELTSFSKFNPQFDTTPSFLETLNLDNCIALETLFVNFNNLSELNIANSTSISSLDVEGNNLINLNLTQYTNLTALNCSNNNLSSLNIKNGNNTNLDVLVAYGNPNLTCIQVDDPIYAYASGWSYVEASYSTNCGSSAGHPDYNALVAFYNATNGPNWTSNTNWLDENQPVSTWHGITEVNGRVNEIVLGGNNLTGSIPPEIGNLTAMQKLALVSNSLTGTIPSELGNIPNINNIDLRLNQLSGNIPLELTNLSVLQQLYLSNNSLTGTIPDFTTLTNTNLIFLYVDNNNYQFGDFESEFPDYVSDLGTGFNYAPQISPAQGVNTITLDIGASTTLNSEPISGVNNIYQWYFNGQAISGANTIDLILSNFQANEVGTYECVVSNTIVTGLSISAGIFEVGLNPALHPDYDALVALYNSTNGSNWFNNTNWLDVTKPINTWYGVLTLDGTGDSRVTAINLNSNNLNGIIPDEIGDLTNLFNFYLSYNNLTGALPLTISNLTLMSGFNVINNNLAGELPDISNITDLSFINIQNNKYIFADLESQYVNYNNKMGANFVYAPQQLIDNPYGVATTIGATTNLNALTDLGSNLIIDWYKLDNLGNYIYLASGPTYDLTINTIADYGNYIYYVTSPTLTALGLESNPITVGPDPSTHADYAALVALYNSTNGDNWTTNTNWLDNTKPLSTWHGVTIENNRVTSIALGSNNLTGVLPTEIGSFTELQYLLLWSNQIGGAIPPEIGNLSNLIELDLSPNTFTGSIPPEIGNLTNLEVLWLNQNGLSGNIPTSFQNLVNLQQLHLVGSAGPPYSSSSFSGDFPDLTTLPLFVLDIRRNYFTFNDVADEFATYQANIQFFDFSPQYTIDLPEETTSLIGDNITLTLTDVTSTSRNSLNNLAINSYQWFKDDVIISGATASSFTITNAQVADSGVYHCEISNTDVPGLVVLRQDITVSIGTLSLDDSELHFLSIYPNPVKETFNIRLNNFQNTSASLYDIRGRLILNQKLNSEVSAINISNLNNGVYLLKINAENKTITKRIIKK